MSARTCQRCGGPIVGRRVSAKFCSDNCRKRTWANYHNRARCQDCEAMLGEGSLHRGVVRCYPCHIARETVRVDARTRQVEGWWAEGLLLREIAGRLGWSVAQVGVEMVSLRAKGFDLPYRYAMRNGKRVAA